MFFSEKTKEVLNNFSEISDSILFLKGNVQRTMTPSKSLFVEAELDEDLEQEFGIYNLSTFLSLMSLFKVPSIAFSDKHLEISEGEVKAKYMFCEPTLIKHPAKDKSIQMPDVMVSFELAKDVLNDILKSAKILNVPHFVIEGDGETISIIVKNTENSSSDIVTRIVGKTDKNFTFVLDIETMKLLNHNYDVTVSEKGLVCFSSNDMKLKYFVPVQANGKK